jgi:RimJ/RimL family protein N-acetyltransferase
MQLRTANSEDAKLLFDWANDPVTRLNSINSNQIEWEVHLNWFKSALGNSNILILILSKDEFQFGSIRFSKDPEEEYYALSFVVSPNYRGKGIGSKLVLLGIEYLKHKDNSAIVNAWVKTSNVASSRIFQKLSFTNKGTSSIKNVTYSIYEI